MGSKGKLVIAIIDIFSLAIGFGYIYGKSKRMKIYYYQPDVIMKKIEDMDKKMTLVAIGDALIHNSIYEDAYLGNVFMTFALC